MVHKEPSERKKGKPRGRPFPSGSKRAKPKDGLLDAPGSKSGIEGRVVAPRPQSSIVEETKGGKKDLTKTPTLEASAINETLKENIDSPQVEPEKKVVDDEAKSLELIDSLEFKNGENTLTIRFSKKHNRMFRIQVFLNGESEIRPVTYTGASTGYAFWNLLKGSLKK